MPLTVEEHGGKIALANDAFNFNFDRGTGHFSIRRAGADTPALVECTAQVVYRLGGRARTVRMDDEGTIVWKDAPGRDAHGTGRHSLFYWTGADARLGLTVVMYDELPFLLLRLTLSHRDQASWTVESLMPVTAGERPGGGLQLPGDRGLACLRNGWASWSPAGRAACGEDSLDGQFTRHARTAFLNAQTPPGTRTRLWSESFTVLAATEDGAPRGTGLVAGFVSLGDQFGAVGVEAPVAPKGAPAPVAALELVAQCDDVDLPPDTSLASEWAYLQWVDVTQPDAAVDYVQAVARQMDVRVPVRGPVGWAHEPAQYGALQEADVLAALDAAVRGRDTLPIELVQVGSGYAELPGDWMQVNSTKFPHGMAWLAEQIRAQGCTPGVWLAPFVAHPDSLVAADHPDWLLHDSGGRPVVAGMLGGANVFALDTSHPGVLEWLGTLIHRVRRDWGFPCIELDYLYAAALPGRRHDASLTRAQALRHALLHIRETAGPDTFLRASGCPLGPAIGLVNAMRIGPDGAPAWYARGGRWAAAFKPGPVMPGARNAIRNALVRGVLHRRWWLNDPDALLLREAGEEPGALTEAEARSLASVAGLSGGLRVFGDDLAGLSPARRALAAVLLPDVPQFATALDVLERELPERYVLHMERPHGRWIVAGVFNWEDSPRDIRVRLCDLRYGASGPWHVYDFWTRQYHRLTADEWLLPQVPAHGVHLLGIRPLLPGPHLVATSFHFSQGGEVTGWESGGARLGFTVVLGRRAEGEVLLWTPAPVMAATCAGGPVEVQAAGGGVTVLRFTVDKSARVDVVLG